MFNACLKNVIGMHTHLLNITVQLALFLFFNIETSSGPVLLCLFIYAQFSQIPIWLQLMAAHTEPNHYHRMHAE